MVNTLTYQLPMTLTSTPTLNQLMVVCNRFSYETTFNYDETTCAGDLGLSILQDLYNITRTRKISIDEKLWVPSNIMIHYAAGVPVDPNESIFIPAQWFRDDVPRFCYFAMESKGYSTIKEVLDKTNQLVLSVLDLKASIPEQTFMDLREQLKNTKDQLTSSNPVEFNWAIKTITFLSHKLMQYQISPRHEITLERNMRFKVEMFSCLPVCPVSILNTILGYSDDNTKLGLTEDVGDEEFIVHRSIEA